MLATAVAALGLAAGLGFAARSRFFAHGGGLTHGSRLAYGGRLAANGLWLAADRFFFTAHRLGFAAIVATIAQAGQKSAPAARRLATAMAAAEQTSICRVGARNSEQSHGQHNTQTQQVGRLHLWFSFEKTMYQQRNVRPLQVWVRRHLRRKQPNGTAHVSVRLDYIPTKPTFGHRRKTRRVCG